MGTSVIVSTIKIKRKNGKIMIYLMQRFGGQIKLWWDNKKNWNLPCPLKVFILHYFPKHRNSPHDAISLFLPFSYTSDWERINKPLPLFAWTYCWNIFCKNPIPGFDFLALRGTSCVYTWKFMHCDNTIVYWCIIAFQFIWLLIKT